MSLSTENFICRNRNTILACNISRSFADHSSMILNSKVDKFYTGRTLIIQKNRRVNFESKFNTFRKNCGIMEQCLLMIIIFKKSQVIAN